MHKDNVQTHNYLTAEDHGIAGASEHLLLPKTGMNTSLFF